MSYTQWDKGFFGGWREGYEQALDDIRQDFLDLQVNKQIPIEVFEVINKRCEKLNGGSGKVLNLPKCEDETDLVFNNID